MSKIQCPRCGHKHLTISDHPDGLNPEIKCVRCDTVWSAGKDGEPYASGKFTEDKRERW